MKYFLLIPALLVAFTGCRKKDNTPPVISLTGGTSMQQVLNVPWSDPGFSATDDKDGDLTPAVAVTGTVNKDFAGDYRITYSVSDEAGNETSVVRTVSVYNEARFLAGSYTGVDTCQAAPSRTYAAVLTPSNYTNKEFFIDHFGGRDSSCACDAVVKLKVSGTASGSSLSWSSQLIGAGDSLVASANGGSVTSLAPAKLQVIYQWKTGGTTSLCTGFYTHQ